MNSVPNHRFAKNDQSRMGSYATRRTVTHTGRGFPGAARTCEPLQLPPAKRWDTTLVPVGQRSGELSLGPARVLWRCHVPTTSQVATEPRLWLESQCCDSRTRRKLKRGMPTYTYDTIRLTHTGNWPASFTRLLLKAGDPPNVGLAAVQPEARLQ